MNKAFARATDPQTSHEAAASVQKISETQQAILLLLTSPMTDDELVDAYYNAVDRGIAPNASPSGIRSRRAELAKRGLVTDTQMRARLASGRRAIIWTAGCNHLTSRRLECSDCLDNGMDCSEVVCIECGAGV